MNNYLTYLAAIEHSKDLGRQAAESRAAAQRPEGRRRLRRRLHLPRIRFGSQGSVADVVTEC